MLQRDIFFWVVFVGFMGVLLVKLYFLTHLTEMY